MQAEGGKNKPANGRSWPKAGLYVLTADVPDLLQRVEQVLQAGARIVQYRDKSQDVDKRLRQAEALRTLTLRHGAWLIINDDMQLAGQVEADGVHLGREDGGLQQARQLLGPQAIVGVSCYADLHRAMAMQAAGADYLAFGRLFTSPTKPDATPCSLGLLRQAVQQLQRPVVAIGGIDHSNADKVLQTGIGWLAVSSSVFLAQDPGHAAARLLQCIHSRGL